jgi:hypothetical protein
MFGNRTAAMMGPGGTGGDIARITGRTPQVAAQFRHWKQRAKMRNQRGSRHFGIVTTPVAPTKDPQ